MEAEGRALRAAMRVESRRLSSLTATNMAVGAACLGLIRGGLVCIFDMRHMTWSIHFACHRCGSRPFATYDHSRNSVMLGVLAMSEGSTILTVRCPRRRGTG